MSGAPEIEQLERLRRLRARMGGAEGVARQHAQARDRARARRPLGRSGLARGGGAEHLASSLGEGGRHHLQHRGLAGAGDSLDELGPSPGGADADGGRPLLLRQLGAEARLGGGDRRLHLGFGDGGGVVAGELASEALGDGCLRASTEARECTFSLAPFTPTRGTASGSARARSTKRVEERRVLRRTGGERGRRPHDGGRTPCAGQGRCRLRGPRTGAGGRP